MSELSVGSLSGLAANSYVIDVASGSSLDLSNGATLPAGSIIAVKHALFTGTQSASVAGGSNVAVTDLSITHEVADASNKLIVTAFFGVAASTLQRTGVGIAIHDGTGLINVGDSAGSRTRVSSGGWTAPTDSTNVVSWPFVTFVHTPGAGSKTYTARAINSDGATRTLYINRGQSDTDSVIHPRGVSALIIQEVVG